MINEYVMMLADAIGELLCGYKKAVYLLEGKRDKIITVTEKKLEDDDAGALIGLRQRLSSKNRKNDPIMNIEGAFLTLASLNDRSYDRAVYLGDRGERITDRYVLTSLRKIDFLDRASLLMGEDIKDRVIRPGMDEIVSDASVLVERIDRGRADLKDEETVRSLSGYLSYIEYGEIDRKYDISPETMKNTLFKKICTLKEKGYG